jgi:hypothetical protein
MTSRNIAVFVTGGTKKLTLDEPFLTRRNSLHGTAIQLKQATVLWKFKNILSTNNKFEVSANEKELSGILPNVSQVS